jgi:HD superfamily phosphohydrolase
LINGKSFESKHAANLQTKAKNTKFVDVNFKECIIFAYEFKSKVHFMDGYKIINDPVFGFIKIRMGLIYDIVQHPLFQRLNRINQLGLASVVYPGARHTRFQHSLGALYLMSEAVKSLKEKGVYIFDSEEEAVKIAILLHDIGHGPFSHVLEHTLMHGISHEDISLLMMEQINREKHGELNLAISIFKDEYPNKIFHQLISSQLDMDRLDYLRRDSFFTGVTEGNIGSARIIKMLNVKDDRLVIESKGIYSIENFLTTRRLMYWQVYLHRTAVGYEKILVNTLLRAKDLVRSGKEIFAAPALAYFLGNEVNAEWFATHDDALQMYADLDDSDIWSALKVWKNSDDIILSTLATDMLDRHLFTVEVSEEPPAEEYLQSIRDHISLQMGIPVEDTRYLMTLTEIGKDMYNPEDDSIGILYKDGTVKDIAEASEILNVQLLSKKIRKYYLCYHRF